MVLLNRLLAKHKDETDRLSAVEGSCRYNFEPVCLHQEILLQL